MHWDDRSRDWCFGDDEAFQDHYCAGATRELDPAQARPILRRLTEILPRAAHAMPRWNRLTGPVVAIGRLTERFSIIVPRLGLHQAHGRLRIWADAEDVTAFAAQRASMAFRADWQTWRADAENKLSYATAVDAPPDGDPLQEGRVLWSFLDWMASKMPEAPDDLCADARVELGHPSDVAAVYPKLVEAARRGAAPAPRRAKAPAAARGVPKPAPPRTAGQAPTGAIEDATHKARAVLIADPVATAEVRCGVPFLDLHFTIQPGRDVEALRGPGLYGVLFTPPDDKERLVYVGSYLPFGGDVARQRWRTHLASFTMRGDRIHIGKRSADRIRQDPQHPFRALADAAGIHKDAGNGAGWNRIRFAERHWASFEPAPERDVLQHFRLAYVRLLQEPPDITRDRLRREILDAEDALIEALAPACNYQTRRAREDVDAALFITAARQRLADLWPGAIPAPP